MAEQTVRRESEQTQKEPYEKPTLGKHGNVKDITAGFVSAERLGCTKLFI